LEFFTPDEMRRIFAVCREERPRFYNAFSMLAHTGTRANEIRRLRPEDVDADRQAVWVVGKGDTRRQLILSGPMQPAWDALLREAHERPRPDGYFFPQGPTWFWKQMEILGRLAFGEVEIEEDGRTVRRAVKHSHPHMLRHTFATMALLHFAPAWDIARLAKWLGHREIGTTYRIYGHLIAAAPPSGYVFEESEEALAAVQCGTACFGGGLSSRDSKREVERETGFEPATLSLGS